MGNFDFNEFACIKINNEFPRYYRGVGNIAIRENYIDIYIQGIFKARIYLENVIYIEVDNGKRVRKEVL